MSITEHAREWAAHDPDPETAAYVLDLVEDPKSAAELASRFSGPLAFGTAGLRGEVGAGESRMNRAVVTRATRGLMDWLGRQVDGPRVVVGCDARHGSRDFYTTVAEVISAAGGTALLLPPCLPTPVTAFAVRALGADAGAMITASHNPPADNGYKVYLGGRVATGAASGVQIVPPADAEIMACITAAPPADQIPRDSLRVERVDVLPEYLETAARNGVSDLRIVLTAMHGVGGEVARQALNRAGFHDIHVVAEQFAPDPDFPTVAFPNPEEPGALDLAIALASDVDADLIFALDPDADRCAVAIPTGDGDWRQLSGDETGCLLGDYVAGSCGAGPGRPACWPVPSSPPACSAASPQLTGWSTAPRSPDSNGSRGCPTWCSATKKPSATAATPRTCATRTASPPPSPWRCWLLACVPTGAPSRMCWTASPNASASTPPHQ